VRGIWDAVGATGARQPLLFWDRGTADKGGRQALTSPPRTPYLFQSVPSARHHSSPRSTATGGAETTSCRSGEKRGVERGVTRLEGWVLRGEAREDSAHVAQEGTAYGSNQSWKMARSTRGTARRAGMLPSWLVA